MVHLADLSESERSLYTALDCPTFETQPWVEGPPLTERRVAVISTAGLQRRGDRPFTFGAVDYRIVPANIEAGDLVMSHVSTNYDRSGFQMDLNVVFPVDRLRELAADGVIGSVADYHYSFMGATAPEQMEAAVRNLAGPLKQDRVDAVLLVPV
jgi:D-proline reductase (dithiol) PrdB